jgi:hypothetical protein
MAASEIRVRVFFACRFFGFLLELLDEPLNQGYRGAAACQLSQRNTSHLPFWFIKFGKELNNRPFFACRQQTHANAGPLASNDSIDAE